MRRAFSCAVLALGCCALLAEGELRAQEFPEPSDSFHTVDMYVGSAIGSARIIGMGGTAAATAQGSSGMLSNPASPGVRPTTSNSTWDWDWHFDTRTSVLGTDIDNNGLVLEDDKNSLSSDFRPNLTAGLALQYKDWGIGFTALNQSTLVAIDAPAGMEAGVDDRLETTAGLGKITLSHYMVDGQLVVGGGLQTVALSATSTIAGQQTQLFSLSGAGLEAGVLWKPNKKSWRAAASYSLPVISDTTVRNENCSPLDCAGYVVPNKVKVPWRSTIGIAGRRAATEWNQQVKSRWRDERYLLWAADLVITGPTRRGIGLEAFSQHQLQPSGRKTSVSLRGGVEYEWFPGRFRLRGGSYFEPSRFRDAQGEEVPGRVHITTGFDWRIWDFDLEFWGLAITDNRYRLQLAFSADVARKFNNSGLSIGLWH